MEVDELTGAEGFDHALERLWMDPRYFDAAERKSLIEKNRDLLGADCSIDAQLYELPQSARQEFGRRLRADAGIAAKISDYVEARTGKVDDSIGLSPVEVVDDLIRHAETCRKSENRFGYLFPCHVDDENAEMSEGTNAGFAHVEGFLITEGGHVINAFPSGTAIEPTLHRLFNAAGKPLFNTNVSEFVDPPDIFSPQARTKACASLSIAFLTEYLSSENPAQSAHAILATGAHKGRPFHFAVPPAATLRHSESDLYLKILTALVTGKQAIEKIEHDGKTYSVTTFAGMAASGRIRFRHLNGRAVSADEFSRYRDEWTKKMQREVQPERSRWNVETGNKKINFRLNWLTQVHAKDGSRTSE